MVFDIATRDKKSIDTSLGGSSRSPYVVAILGRGVPHSLLCARYGRLDLGTTYLPVIG